MDTKSLDEYIQVWQCVGCGRIEAPQTCIGVCRDKKVFLIGKDTHERVHDELVRLRNEIEAVRAKLLRFTQCTPSDGQFENSFRALQSQVRALVDNLSRAAT